MPPRLSWSKLLPGLIALAVIAAIAIGVLAFAGVGKVRGETMRLYVLSEQAHGVMAGTEVWLFGQKVGVVEAVGFRAPSADTTGRVVIAIDVREEDAAAIRRDAPVSVRTGANIMGPIVVYLGAGDPAAPPVREGDTLRARPRIDVQTAGEQLSAATAQMPAILADARTVMSLAKDRRGSLGAFLAGDASRDLSAARAAFARLRSSPARDAIRDPMRAAKSALARADSIRALLRSPNTTLGRFRRDSTLMREVAGLRDEFAALRTLMDTADGTLRRWRTDSAIVRSIADAQREMTLLFDDMRRRPLRYSPF